MWKEKVVNFVKRVIGYKEIAPAFVVYDTKKVIVLRAEKCIPDIGPYRPIDRDYIKLNLKKDVVYELCNDIVNQGLCEIEYREEHDRCTISAEIRIVKI